MTIFQRFIFNPLVAINYVYPLAIVSLLKDKNCNFWLAVIICILTTYLFTGLVLLLSKLLEESYQTFEEVLATHKSFIPSCLCYCFCFLGFFFGYFYKSNTNQIIIGDIALAILFLAFFTFQASIFIFNPLFVLFGFRFYLVFTNNKRVLLITRKKNVSAQDKYTKLFRINNLTFIDWEKY